ncbi:lytic transglycosylase domain-containing protein [Acidovorax sp. CCYZU-2555]|uniref:lytic transglycosylase domain-containing protein n=1 Tax=Acidovorax sp. CCYZU-2555 TaxID=2835042 RepID=UPI001BCFF339|nr:lytic transglycosylase domain-containing protein [Acidovorax sp. CCYZU-2555]MBS7776857.1 lytic transglycosylase domain-containing protein [Acidovorax sp. CCYZU-2555]
MRVRSAVTVLAGLLTTLAPLAEPHPPAQPLSFEKLAAECAPGIHPATLKAVVSTESSWNPYAIGIVGGTLVRQPRSLAEAVATARALERQGFNFSMGLGQVNRHNLSPYGETYETVFQPCRNLKLGGAILQDCFLRAQKRMGDAQSALRAAFSCYYSGNFTRGFRADKAGQPSYVQKVVGNANSQALPIPVVPAIQPQKADSAVPVRAADMPPADAKRSASIPSHWVIFAESLQVEHSAAQPSAEREKEPATKLRLGSTRDALPPTPAPPPPQSHAQSDRKDAPFVQFIH